MNAENTDTPPKFNLLAPEGVKPQVHADLISFVLLDDGQWYPVAPQSFKLYQSVAKTPAFGPYATFILDPTVAEGHPLAGMTIEVFPVTVKGWAF